VGIFSAGDHGRKGKCPLLPNTEDESTPLTALLAAAAAAAADVKYTEHAAVDCR